MKAANGNNPIAWLISGDQSLSARVQTLLYAATEKVRTITPDLLNNEEFWSTNREELGLIVLDIDDSVDWGLWVLRELQRARIKAPIVVMSNNFSREFGAKIVSQGVRYYFAHDFSEAEFTEVVGSLLHPRRGPD
jgi:DNA-binding NarL/FixJ family response regulator